MRPRHAAPRTWSWTASGTLVPLDEPIGLHDAWRIGRERLVLRGFAWRAARERHRASRPAGRRRASRAAPRAPRAVSSGSIAVSRAASIGPASSAFTTRMIVTPVRASPSRMARCDRRRPAVTRQQRRVDVDHAEPRQIEQHLRQDPAVGGDHAEVGRSRAQGDRETTIFQTVGLPDSQTGGFGARLDGRSGDVLAASTGTVGLRDDRHHLVRAGDQRLERGHREIWGAEEDDPHGCDQKTKVRTVRRDRYDRCDRCECYQSPRRRLASMRRTISRRLTGLSRSMKSTPSR